MAGLEHARALSHMPIVFGRVAPDLVLAIAALPEVFSIEEDRVAFATRAEGGSLIRANRLRNDFGATGAGAGVAVIDSGIDADHPELGNRVVVSANFTDEPGDGTNDGDQRPRLPRLRAAGERELPGRFRKRPRGRQAEDEKACAARTSPGRGGVSFQV